MDIIQENLRTPPQNIEAEQAVLGAILVNSKALEKVSEFLQPNHFVHPVHRKIYEACRNFIEQGRIADVVMLKPLFIHDEDFKDVGGVEYLAKLASASIHIVNVADYGRQILDCYLRRQLIELGTNIVNNAFDIQKDTAAMGQVEQAEKGLYNLANESELDGGPMTLSEALQQTLQSTQTAMNNPSGISGTPTGLTDIDRLLGGLYDSDLIILAGRPAMGKSALATTIAFNAAKFFHEANQKPGAIKKSVALFSLEMSAEQIAGRILSAKAQVPNHQMRTGKLTTEQFDDLAASVDLLSRIPLEVDETANISVTAIKTRARRMQRDPSKGLGLIVIDYLQLISANKKTENRVQELSDMTRNLKIMAKELKVPVIVLSQLSRLVEARDNKRPMLSDLRESGSIEQDADIVMFVYREIYYLMNEQPKQRINETPEKFQLRCADLENKKKELANQAEVIIAKHRHGNTGTVPLYFNGEFSEFGNLTKEE